MIGYVDHRCIVARGDLSRDETVGSATVARPSHNDEASSCSCVAGGQQCERAVRVACCNDDNDADCDNNDAINLLYVPGRCPVFTRYTLPLASSSNNSIIPILARKI